MKKKKINSSWTLFHCFKFILKISLVTIVIGFIVWQLLLINVPDITLLKDQNPSYTSYMLSDENVDSGDKSIVYTPLSQVSPHFIKAILASEDDLYFTHNGYNWKEISKALKINLERKKYVRGGSTITQQLARNLFLSRDKSLFRKVREWILTYKLESNLSKERILELYVNSAEFGPGVYGIKAASQYHFKTKPKNLSPSQSALLAAILPNPKLYGKKPYPGRTYNRQRNILYRMARYNLHIPDNLFAKSSKKSQSNGIKLIPIEKNTKDDFKEFDETSPTDVFMDE